MPKPLAVVAGAGPAGLTFAHELLKAGSHRVLVLEPEPRVGGLACTVEDGGRRLDLGGHRFFSASDRILEWWADMLPFDLERDVEIGYQNSSLRLDSSRFKKAEPGAEKAFLVRPRVSRILYDGRFFDYPLSLSPRTLRALGAGRLLAFAASWLAAKLAPGGAPRNLEEFFVARFGRRLYETFFKSYTEKVWGRPCSAIGAQWGAQRVKALSVLSALKPARKESFLYPRLGPGQLWEEAARRIEAGGGEIRLGRRVTRVEYDGARVTAVEAGERIPCDVFVSSMPVRDLFAALTGPVPQAARAAAAALEYRDFLTVGLLVDGLAGGPVPDNWIYVHSPEVKLGRIQIYNNWSEGMIADREKTWLGLEYFCAEGDALWSRSDESLAALGAEELKTLGLLAPDAPVRASRVLRVPKAYPAYWGGHERFGAVREFVDGVPNLLLIGRNGMHRYNNQDHSMLSAMAAVERLARGGSKAAAWAVNAGDEHVEARA